MIAPLFTLSTFASAATHDYHDEKHLENSPIPLPKEFYNVTLNIESTNSTLNGKNVISQYSEYYNCFIYNVNEKESSHLLLGKDNLLLYQPGAYDDENKDDNIWAIIQSPLLASTIVGTMSYLYGVGEGSPDFPYNHMLLNGSYMSLNGTTDPFYACTENSYDFDSLTNATSPTIIAVEEGYDVPSECSPVKLHLNFL